MGFLTLILLFIFCSCNPIQKENYIVDKITLELSESESKIKLSEIIDSIVYIPLETNGQSLLGNIDRIIGMENGNFLIVDKNLVSEVLVFDSVGHFLNKIGKKGSAPSEYVMIEDIAYYNQTAYIWDSSSRKILEYSLDGNWKNSYRFDYVAYSFSCINPNEFVFYCDYVPNNNLLKENKYPNYIKFNVKTGLIDSDLYFDKDVPSHAFLLSLNNLSNNLIYSTMNDTIYMVEGGLLKQKYVLNYKDKYKRNRENYLKDMSFSSSDATNSDKCIFPQLITYFECNNMNLLFLRMGSTFYYVLYYPETGVCREASSTTNPIVNDIDETAQFIIYYSKDNVLYSVMEPELIIEKNPSLAKSLSLSYDDNLVLVKMFLKE